MTKEVITWLYNKYVRGEPMIIDGKKIWPMPMEKCGHCIKHNCYYHPALDCFYCHLKPNSND